MVSPKVTLEDRFWSKVNKSGPIPAHKMELGPCWVWTASTSGAGYGQFWIKGRGLRGSHTVSWSLMHGPIPDGMDVCHHCDNPPCVRPDHLFLGTRSENMRDMGRKGRGGRGGAKGEQNSHAKLTESQVIEIRTRFAAGELGYVLAAEFGLGFRKLSRIVCGHAWGHVGGPIQPWDSPRRKAARERYQASTSRMDGAA